MVIFSGTGTTPSTAIILKWGKAEMIEKEAQRERETELSTQDYQYEDWLKEVILEKERVKRSRKIIKGSQIPFTLSRQGVVRRLVSMKMTDTATDSWWMFVHEIRQHSGRHVHQGGLMLFVLQGRGYTVVDGQRNDWSIGDLIMLPIKKGGVEHQHFNLDDKPSRWLAFIYFPLNKAVGWFMEHRGDSSVWKERKSGK